MQTNALKAAFTVSKKNFKRAVDRNRIRRLMKESWRLQKNALQLSLQANGQSLIVFLIFTGKALPEYQLVQKKIEQSIQKFLTLLEDHKNKSV